jgi:pentatricopeptide repeat protein
MNILWEVIKNMGSEEIRTYKYYASRSYQDKEERKDLRLFDMYRKSETPDDDKILTRIYGPTASKNVFFRLKNRLLEDINRSVILSRFDTPEMDAYLAYCLFRHFYAQNQMKSAGYYLRKAEKKAIEYGDLELLDIIYSRFISLSLHLPEIDPRKIATQREENAARMDMSKKIEQITALLSYGVRRSQQYGDQEKNLTKYLEDILNSVSLSADAIRGTIAELRIGKAVCQILLQENRLTDMRDYLEQRMTDILHFPARFQPEQELIAELIIFYINALNALGDYPEAIKVCGQLKEHLQLFGQGLYEKYAYYYYLSMVNAWSEQKMYEKSLDILNEMEEKGITGLHPVYIIYHRINKAVCYYMLKNYTQAIKTLTSTYRIHSYSSLDDLFKLKVEIAEAMMRYDRDDLEGLELRVNQIKRNYRELLNKTTAESLMLDVLYGLSVQNLTTDFSHVLEFMKTHESYRPIIDYREWISSKIHKSL